MAGVKREGRGYGPTGTGRLCEWKEDPSEPAELSRYVSGKYILLPLYQLGLHLHAALDTSIVCAVRTVQNPSLLSYSIIPQGLSEPTRELFHFSVKKASQEFYSGRLTGTLPTLSITNVILTGEEAVQSDHQA